MDPPENPELAEEDGPDFSLLPEVAWVRVMEELPLVDRYHLSMTCHTLHQIFCHPSLWRTVSIRLMGATSNFSTRGSFVPRVFKCMTEQFGHLFQDLYLSLSGFLVKLDEESVEVVRLLANHCRLESLTLEVGQITNKYNVQGWTPDLSNVQLLLAFIHNAFRLRHLHLVAWPMHSIFMVNPKHDIFQAIKANSKLKKSLETLSLFWPRNRNWCERDPLMPKPECIVELVAALPNLTTLCLRQPLLSDQLLVELSQASRPQLKLMEILVAYSPHNQDLSIPDLSPKVWSRLTKHSPRLRVKCTVMTGIPSMELDQLLRACVPLSSLTLLKFAKCDEHLLGSLAAKYEKTLEELVCLCDTDPLDEILLSLVDRCQRLHQLVFKGKVHYKTVERLAKLRGPAYRQFVFSWANISTEDQDEEQGPTEDEVIARDANGELYLVDLHRFHVSDEDREKREERKASMIQAVSQSLKDAWAPAD